MSRVRVALLGDAMCDPRPRGLARYTRGLCAALLESGAVDLELVTHGEPSAAGLPAVVRSPLTARREVVREQLELPRLLARRAVDVLHAPANRGLPVWAPCPTVLTRHDVIERLFATELGWAPRSRLRRRYADAIAMRRATAVATVSETARRDVARVWPGVRARTVVAGQGVEARFFEPVASSATARLRERFALPSSFVLYVGGFEPRKDVPTLIRAVAACGVRDVGLVLAGALGPWGAAVEAAVAAAGVTARTRVLDFVADDDLPALYATAACLACPSRYEGFGLPVVEAMAAGAPTIVTDGGALPEVAGDAALVVAVADVGALARAFERVLTDARTSARLVEQGRQRAAAHRWERVVQRYIVLYRRLADAGTMPPAAQPVPA